MDALVLRFAVCDANRKIHHHSASSPPLLLSHSCSRAGGRRLSGAERRTKASFFLRKAVTAMQLIMPLAEIGIFGKSYDRISGCSFRSWIFKPSLVKGNLKFIAVPTEVHGKRSERRNWKIAFALDTGGSDATGDSSPIEDSSAFGGTRLVSIVRAASRQLLQKLNVARRNFPMKIFLLLLGFYTANALATILGQTGDWDVLVAGVVVAAIEGIGMLMYRKPLQLPVGRLQSFVVMVNYWKAGVCLGLFVDAFKLGS
ncbi:ycf20-like protein isoform X2 [Nymphaea colorata]|uniref:ycf20-like protein isoform X2 n=1 Tax=Nymphaea colorata TaxID=210225 RepID=UPI00129D8554|nr:ycf20-like protein isoform X2 [Nymphaea colorata]